MYGRIVKGVREFFDVFVETGEFKDKIVRCNSKGIFRFERDSIRPLTGDAVEIEINKNNKDDTLGLIKKIHERKNFLIRPPVANLDILFIVSAVKSPAPAYFFIDKLTACAIYNDITPVIIANKIDLLDDGEKCELYDIYNSTEFKTIKVSAVSVSEASNSVNSINSESEAGFDEIRQEMRGKICAFAGVSGAGKSSILNRLFKHLNLETGSLSEKIERGKHTTRSVELFRHDLDGYAADTPGFSMLDFDYIEVVKDKNKKEKSKGNESKQNKEAKESMRENLRDELISLFPDLCDYSDSGCKYRRCTHTKEDGCKVLGAVSEGLLAKSRHESYVELYEYLKSQEY
jgi:ribosome biogenesis GTPase